MTDTVSMHRARGFSIPTVIVLSLFMAALLYFFVFQFSSQRTRAAALIVSAGLLALFIALQATGNISRYRRIFFSASAFLFFPSFISYLLEARGSMSVGAMEAFLNTTPFCHIVIPQAILPYLFGGVLVFPARLTNSFASAYAMIAIWLIATLTVGRGWCSWVCFYGGWDDASSRAFRRPRLPIKDEGKKIRYFSFAVLAFVALAGLATMTSVYCSWLCPFKTVTEYGEITDMASYIAFISFILLFFGLAIVLPMLTRRRTQCMSLCPFGAFQSIAGRVSPYRVRIDAEKCTGCGTCATVCPVMAIDEASLGTGKPKVLATCLMCGECVTACPKGAARYRFAWSRLPGLPSGLAERWRLRLEEAGKTRGFAHGLARALDELSSAQALMTTSGFTIGMIISSSFSVETVARFIQLVSTGSFLLR
jgi:ferredoxin-type protein NapH